MCERDPPKASVRRENVKKYFLWIGLSIGFLVLSNAYCKNDPKLLVINVGSRIYTSDQTLEEHVKHWIAEILKGVYGDQKVSRFDTYPVYEINKAQRESHQQSILMSLDKFYSEAEADKIIVSVILRHYTDVYQGWENNSYPENVLGLMDTAGEEIRNIVGDFRKRYPTAKITGIASATSAKSLILSLEKGVKEFDKVFLLYPLLRQNELEKFEDAIKNNPHTEFKPITGEDFPGVPIPLDENAIKAIVSDW